MQDPRAFNIFVINVCCSGFAHGHGSEWLCTPTRHPGRRRPRGRTITRATQRRQGDTAARPRARVRDGTRVTRPTSTRNDGRRVGGVVRAETYFQFWFPFGRFCFLEFCSFGAIRSELNRKMNRRPSPRGSRRSQSQSDRYVHAPTAIARRGERQLRAAAAAPGPRQIDLVNLSIMRLRTHSNALFALRSWHSARAARLSAQTLSMRFQRWLTTWKSEWLPRSISNARMRPVLAAPAVIQPLTLGLE